MTKFSFHFFSETCADGNTLRRNNLAKSVQWYSPNLIDKPISNACLSKLERILHSEQRKKHTNYSQLHKKQKFEKIVLDIKSAEYHVIEQCLGLIAESNNETVQLIWKLFKQYSDTNFNNFICGYCKIRKRINIRDCGRYFWRHSIISDQLFDKIVSSGSDQASHDALWNDLDDELKHSDTSVLVTEAISATLEKYSNIYSGLRAELREWLCNHTTKFKCSCQKLHSLLSRPADDLESETDTLTSDYDSEEIIKSRRRNHTSRSTSSTRRKKIRGRDSNDQGTRSYSITTTNEHREIIPKRAVPSEMISKSLPDNTISVNDGRKKTTKIFHFTNNSGPVSVGNRFVRVGNQQISDTSNDTDCYSTNASDDDIRKPLQSTGETKKRSHTFRSSRFDTNHSRGYAATFELKELKTGHQDNTVSAAERSCSHLPINPVAVSSNEFVKPSLTLKNDRVDEGCSTMTEKKLSTDGSNTMETTLLTKITASMTVKDMKQTAALTDNSDYETADEGNETEEATVEIHEDSKHNGSNEPEPVEIENVDIGYQRSMTVKKTTLTDNNDAAQGSARLPTVSLPSYNIKNEMAKEATHNVRSILNISSDDDNGMAGHCDEDQNLALKLPVDQLHFREDHFGNHSISYSVEIREESYELHFKDDHFE